MTVIVKEPFQKVLIYGFSHLSCGRDTVPIWPDSPNGVWQRKSLVTRPLVLKIREKRTDILE